MSQPAPRPDDKLPATLEFQGRSPRDNSPETRVGDTSRSSSDCSFSITQHLVGKQIGDYELLEEIARGGMGVVYRARHCKLNRLVAVKMILSGEFANQDEVRRFYGEAEAAAQLDHPSIVPVHEVGEHDGRPFFSMAFVEGQSLAQRLASGPLPPRDVAELVKQIAEAVAYAHQRGVIHRDLKPANILLGNAGPKEGHARSGFSEHHRLAVTPRITDFGLHKRLSDDHGLTATGQILGTPSYMAPEQARGEQTQIGPRTDVYALGAILYACLSGRPPFQGASLGDTLRQVEQQRPAALRHLNAAVPVDLETITLKCLEKSPERRYQSATDLVEELTRFLRGEPIQARPIGQVERAWRWSRRNPVGAALAAAIAIIVLGLAAGGPVWAMREFKLRADAETQKSIAVKRGDLLQNQQQQLAKAVKLANQQIRQSRARYLAAESMRAANEFPIRSLLLAAEAVQATRKQNEPVLPVAEEALRESLARVGGFRLGEHAGLVTCCSFSPDSRLLVTGSYDTTVHVWDLSAADPVASEKVLRGHEDYVTDVVFGEDSRTLVTRGNEKALHIWDLSVAEPVAVAKLLRPHGESYFDVALSSDGKRMATAGWDKVIRVWDLAATSIADSAKTVVDHESPLTCVRFAVDGQALFAGDFQGNVLLVDLATGAKRVMRGHSSVVTGLQLSRDGKTLVSIGSDNTLSMWDLQAENLESGRKVLFAGAKASIRGFTLTPDSRRLIMAQESGAAEVWDLTAKEVASSQKTLYGHEGRILDLAVTPDARFLVTSGYDHAIRIWDLTAPDPNTTVNILRGHDDSVRAVALSPDGSRLATVSGNQALMSGDNSVRLWDLTTLGTSVTAGVLYQDSQSVTPLLIGPLGTSLITGSGRSVGPAWIDFDGILRLWDLSVIDPHSSMKVLNGRFLNSSTDGRVFATRDKQTFSVWEWSTDGSLNQPKALWSKQDSAIKWVQISPTGDSLYIGGDDKTIKILRLANGQELPGAPTITSPLLIESPPLISSNGRTMLAVAENMLFAWDLSASDPASTLKQLTSRQEGIRCMAMTADGKTLVTGSNDTTACVWDLSQRDPNQAVKILRGHQSYVTCLAITPDNRTLVTGVRDNQVHVWNLSAPDPQATMKMLLGHTHWIWCLEISNDGRTLATGGSDGEPRLWDLTAMDPSATVRVLRGALGGVNGLAFTPDGQALVSGHDDGTLRVWDLRTDALLSLVRPAAGRELSPEQRASYGIVDSESDVPAKDVEPFPWQRPLFPSGANPEWHAIMSQNCEERAHWFGVYFHLQRLAGIRSLTLEQRERRGVALLGLKRYAEAVDEFSSVLQEEPGRVRAIDQRVEANIWLQRWKEVIPDMDALCEMFNNDPALWSRCAIVHLGAGDVEGYTRVCRGMRELWENSEQLDQVLWVTFTCGLHPAGTDSPEILLKQAQLVDEHHSSERHSLMAAYYRNGNYNEALEIADQFSPTPAVTYWAAYYQSMCWARLGQIVEARSAYERGLSAQRTLPPIDPSSPVAWQFVLIAETLRAEAEELLQERRVISHAGRPGLSLTRKEWEQCVAEAKQ